MDEFEEIADQLDDKKSKASEAGTDTRVKVLQEQLGKSVAKNSELKKLLDNAGAEDKELLESNQFLEQFQRKEERWLEHLKKLDRKAKKRKLEKGEINVERKDFAREKKKKNSALEKDLKFLMAENNSIRDKINSIGEENNNLQASVSKILFELAEKSRSLDQLEKQLKSSEAGTDAHVKVLHEQLEKAVGKKSELKELLYDVAAERKELLESIQFFKDENDLLKKELASKCETVEDLKFELLELQKLLDVKREEVEELDNRECEAVEELNKMAEKLEEVNKLKKDQISEINLEVNSLKKDIERLTLRIQEAVDEKKLTLEDFRTENENLREEIEILKINKLELEKDKRKYELEITNLTKKNEALKNQSDFMKKIKDDAVESANELKIKNELLKKEMDIKTYGLESFSENREKSSKKKDKEKGEIKAVADEKGKEKSCSKSSEAKKLGPKSDISYSDFLSSDGDGDSSSSSENDFCSSQSSDSEADEPEKKTINNIDLKTPETKVKSNNNPKKWTPETKTEILKYFRNHVLERRVPRKLEVLECVKNLKIDSLSSLVLETEGRWSKVRDLVYNSYKRKPFSRKIKF